MAFQTIIYEKRDSVGYLTLNRPEKMNALTAQLMSEFRECLEAIDDDSEVRVVILTGAGRAFSAGFDLDLAPGELEPHGSAPDPWREHLKGHVETFLETQRSPARIRGEPGGRGLRLRLRRRPLALRHLRT